MSDEQVDIALYNHKGHAKIKNGLTLNEDKTTGKDRLVVIKLLGTGSYGSVFQSYGDGDNRSAQQRIADGEDGTFRKEYSALKAFVTGERGAHAAELENNNMNTINRKRTELEQEEKATASGFRHIVTKKGCFRGNTMHGSELHYFIEYELCKQTLAQFLEERTKNGGTVHYTTILSMWQQLLKGLQSLESISFSHLDIKPDNIMVADSEENQEKAARQIILRMRNHIPMADDPLLRKAMTPWWRDQTNPNGYRPNRDWFLDAANEGLLPPWAYAVVGRNELQRILQEEAKQMSDSFKNNNRLLWKLNDVNDDAVTMGYTPPEHLIEPETSTTPCFSVYSLGAAFFTTIANEPLLPFWLYTVEEAEEAAAPSGSGGASGSRIVPSATRRGPQGQGTSSRGGAGSGTRTATSVTTKTDMGTGTMYGLLEEAFGSGGEGGPEEQAFIIISMQHALMGSYEMPAAIFKFLEDSYFHNFYEFKSGRTRSGAVGVLHEHLRFQNQPESLRQRVENRIRNVVNFEGKNPSQQLQLIRSLVEILEQMLKLDPRERAPASQLLEHPEMLMTIPYTDEGEQQAYRIESATQNAEGTTIIFRNADQFNRWFNYHGAFTYNQAYKADTRYFDCKKKFDGCPRRLTVTFGKQQVEAKLTNNHRHYEAYDAMKMDDVKRDCILALMGQYQSFEQVAKRFLQMYNDYPIKKLKHFYVYQRRKNGLPIH